MRLIRHKKHPLALSLTLPLSVAALTLHVAPRDAEARPFRVGQIPNNRWSCQLCHVSPGGGARNSFGQDVGANLNAGSADWSAVCNLDSDGDGFTNAQELNDPECLWRLESAPLSGPSTAPFDADEFPDPPMGGEPMGGEPMGGEPMGGEPMGGEPMGGEPMGGEPMGGEPVGGEPVGGEPAGGEPVGGEPVGGEPAGGEPAGGEPAGGEPVGGEPAGGEPVGGEPAGGEPVGGEPVGGEPAGGEPAGGEPAGGEPVGGEPMGGEPVGGEPVGGELSTADEGCASGRGGLGWQALLLVLLALGLKRRRHA